MAAGFNWNQYNGASTSETSLGTGGNLFNFATNDASGTAGYDSNPITAGNNSMEVYLKADFTGTFNQIDNLQFWMSTDFSPSTGLTVKWCPNGTDAYVAPATATSTVADTSVPTGDPGSENVYIGGGAGGSLTAAGMSDYIVLQLQTTTDAAAGDTSLAEFTFNFGTLIAVTLYEKLLKFGEHLFKRQSRAKPAMGKCRDLTGRIFFGRLWESPNFMAT